MNIRQTLATNAFTASKSRTAHERPRTELPLVGSDMASLHGWAADYAERALPLANRAAFTFSLIMSTARRALSAAPSCQPTMWLIVSPAK